MVRLVVWVVVIVAALAGLWLGAESWAAQRAAQAIAQSPRIEAAGVTPLRRPQAFGLRLAAPSYGDGRLRLDLPWAELSLAPSAPRTARLSLPSEGRLRLAGAEHALALRDPEAWLTLAPLRSMAIEAGQLSARDVQLDGQPVAARLEIGARLHRLGHDAPRPAVAAYDMPLRIEGASPEALALLAPHLATLPGDLTVLGQVRVWLDAAPRLAADAQVPRPVGFETAGLELISGEVAVRLVGRIVPDAQGRAEGRLALYTRDAGPIIQQLVALGIIPPGAALLARAGLGQIGRADFPEGDAASPGPAIPAAAEGELRLPLSFSDGQVMLGAVPLGPAPRLLN